MPKVTIAHPNGQKATVDHRQVKTWERAGWTVDTLDRLAEHVVVRVLVDDERLVADYGPAMERAASQPVGSWGQTATFDIEDES